MKTKKKIKKTLHLQSISHDTDGYLYTFYSDKYINQDKIEELNFKEKIKITNIKEFCEVNKISEEEAIEFLINTFKI